MTHKYERIKIKDFNLRKKTNTLLFSPTNSVLFNAKINSPLFIILLTTEKDSPIFMANPFRFTYESRNIENQSKLCFYSLALHIYEIHSIENLQLP